MKGFKPEKSPTEGTHPVSIEARYEALRQAALGEPVSPESRSGLAIFLRRGMWAWALASTALRIARPPLDIHLRSSPLSHLPGALVQGFVALVLDVENRRRT